MDALVVLLYLAGFIVSIIVIVAQCQLFAIRRLLETLVQQQQGSSSPQQSLPFAEAAAPPAAAAETPQDEASHALAVFGIAGALLFVVCFIVWFAFSTPPR